MGTGSPQEPGHHLLQGDRGRAEGLQHKCRIGVGSTSAPWGSTDRPQSCSACDARLVELNPGRTGCPATFGKGRTGSRRSARTDGLSPSCHQPSCPDPLSNRGETPAPLPLPAPHALRGSAVDFPGSREQCLSSSLLRGFLLPRFVSSIFLRSKRAPCLVAKRGRRRGGAAVGGCAFSAGSRHRLPGRCVSARVRPRHCSCAPRRA